MSRTINVVVLCPYGRRENVKVTENSSILQILEEACRKQGLNPDDFDITHYSKNLDLSLPIRFANIPNNALLELRPTTRTRADTLVTVGLQLESGERIMNDFVPSTTIQNVIEQSLSSKSDIVPLEGAEPVCIYMRQKLVGDAIKNTSLRNLGLTKGRAVIRLLYRKPEELDEQAHVSAPLLKSSTPESLAISEEKRVVSHHSSVTKQQIAEQSITNSVTNNEAVANVINNSLECPSGEKSKNPDICNNNQRALTDLNFDKNPICELNPISSKEHEFSSNKDEKPSDEQSMEIDSQGNQDDVLQEEYGEIHYIGDRHAVLYSLDDISDVKKADLPEEFFNLTVDEVKYLMEEYKRTRIELENQPLLTKEQRERNILQKFAHYTQTVIRVYFPERLVLQAVFKVTETVQDVCDFVRNYLEDKELTFYLYITPPIEKLISSRTLLEAMLVPAAVVYFGSESHHSNYLKENLKEKLSDPRAASLAAAESRKCSFTTEPLEISETTTSTVVTENNVINKETVDFVPQLPSRSGEKVPKWLKLSKK